MRPQNALTPKSGDTQIFSSDPRLENTYLCLSYLGKSGFILNDTAVSYWSNNIPIQTATIQHSLTHDTISPKEIESLECEVLEQRIAKKSKSPGGRK